MKQLLIKLSEEEYKALDEYCQKTGLTKSAVVRQQIAKVIRPSREDLLRRKIDRINPGKGKTLSELVIEMRR